MIPHSDPTLAPGHVVAGRYRIEALVGEGGFGAVFRATQLNLGRTVALKVLLPHLVSNDDGLSRFRREAQLAQRLEHPNTVRLFDFGVAEDGTPYIAFEMLKGQPLDALLRTGGKLPPARVARIAGQVLKSLMEAHEHGIVHRDIKPSNIFLCEFSGESDFVKVLDFGIAKALGSTGQTTSALTRAGEAVGTPSYMSPEQVTGAQITPAADLYALGLVMAEALTGEVVMKGDSGIQIVMAQISTAAVPLPPAVLQSPLGPVIHRATQKASDRRYASAKEMLAHLEETTKGVRSVVVSPPVGAGAPAAPAPRDLAYLQTNVSGYAGPFTPQPPAGGPAGGAYAAPPHLASAPPHHASAPPHHPSAPHHASSMPHHAAPMGYGPPPAYGYGPPLPPPAVRRTSGSSYGLILALTFAGLVLLAVIGVGIVAAVGLSSAETSSSSGSSKPGPSVSGKSIAELSTSELKEKAEDAGWSVVSETESRAANIETAVIGVQRGTKFGSIQVMRYADEHVAELVEGSLRNNADIAVTRDGRVILYVMVFQDRQGSNELLDAMSR